MSGEAARTNGRPPECDSGAATSGRPLSGSPKRQQRAPSAPASASPKAGSASAAATRGSPSSRRQPPGSLRLHPVLLRKFPASSPPQTQSPVSGARSPTLWSTGAYEVLRVVDVPGAGDVTWSDAGGLRRLSPSSSGGVVYECDGVPRPASMQVMWIPELAQRDGPGMLVLPDVKRLLSMPRQGLPALLGRVRKVAQLGGAECNIGDTVLVRTAAAGQPGFGASAVLSPYSAPGAMPFSPSDRPNSPGRYVKQMADPSGRLSAAPVLLQPPRRSRDTGRASAADAGSVSASAPAPAPAPAAAPAAAGAREPLAAWSPPPSQDEQDALSALPMTRAASTRCSTPQAQGARALQPRRGTRGSQQLVGRAATPPPRLYERDQHLLHLPPTPLPGARRGQSQPAAAPLQPQAAAAQRLPPPLPPEGCAGQGPPGAADIVALSVVQRDGPGAPRLFRLTLRGNVGRLSVPALKRALEPHCAIPAHAQVLDLDGAELADWQRGGDVGLCGGACIGVRCGVHIDGQLGAPPVAAGPDSGWWPVESVRISPPRSWERTLSPRPAVASPLRTQQHGYFPPSCPPPSWGAQAAHARDRP
eukprot:TRINITY_DN13992_c0_g1_i1.p1 TRINITY_DN13992_c0_g1~~TRINITY_DN13992_c0_g1_i1.p1  ORF type:complete len:589 (+),score=116.36 TRINITY_DN13992_c0_g1_i1:121-1887(+)